MPVFVWDENFLTGRAPIDEQHQVLVDLFNALSDSLTEGKNPEAGELEKTFELLRQYTQHHFREESRLMADAKVDPRHRYMHLQTHRSFIEQLDALWTARHALSNPAQMFLEFLSSWLALHVLRIDRELVRQLALIEAGETPERAYEVTVGETDQRTSVLLAAIHRLYRAISRQNLDLARANRELEERVRDRTRSLELLNQQLNAANERLGRMARVDGLLRIANRSAFDERFVESWRRAMRANQALALLLIDVDDFKKYNDTYGHPAGDRCLRAIAQAVALQLRRGGDFVARYGGEELVVLLPDTALEGAAVQAEQIRSRVQRLAIAHSTSSTGDHVTVSIGVAALVPRPGMHASALIEQADVALYQAKAAGRNRVSAGGEHNAAWLDVRQLQTQ